MNHDKVIDKIKKLLALSTSSNEHEAALAAANAAALMQQHQISTAVLEASGKNERTNEPVGEFTAGDKLDKVVVWKGELALALAESLGCSMFWQFRSELVVVDGNAVPNKDGTAKTVRVVFAQIVGHEAEAQTVDYLYRYLTNEINRLADAAYDPEKDPVYQACERLGKHFSHRSHAARQWKEAYRLGAARMVASRVREQRKKSFDKARADAMYSSKRPDENRGALVFVDKAIARLDAERAAIDAYLKTKRLTTRQSKASVRHDAFTEGQKAGKNINLDGGKALGVGTKQVKE